MDKTDVILSLLLMANSRLSYRELADSLNLSVTAVHNRIQSMVEAGIIRKFTAKPSISISGATHVLIFGTSKALHANDLLTKLGQHGSIYWLAIAGGNYLYVGAYLKNIGELESLVNYIKVTALISEPTVGITSSIFNVPTATFNMSDNRLYELDCRIIGCLKDDSRKATSDIAEELGVSAKTIRRRLGRMIKNYMIELSIDWYPDASNDIMSVFHVRIKPDSDKNVVDRLVKKYFPNVMFCWGFSNIPDTFLFFVWTDTTKELREMRERFESETAVQEATPNVIFTGYIMPIWRDKICP